MSACRAVESEGARATFNQTVSWRSQRDVIAVHRHITIATKAQVADRGARSRVDELHVTVEYDRTVCIHVDGHIPITCTNRTMDGSTYRSGIKDHAVAVPTIDREGCGLRRRKSGTEGSQLNGLVLQT